MSQIQMCTRKFLPISLAIGIFLTTQSFTAEETPGATQQKPVIDLCQQCLKLQKEINVWENSLIVYKNALTSNENLRERIKTSKSLKSKQNSSSELHIILNIANARALIETATNSLEERKASLASLNCNQCPQK